MGTWKNIEAVIRQRGITQRALAEAAGVVPSAVARWKAGAGIKVETLGRIANFLRVPLGSLMGTNVNVANAVRESGYCYPPDERARLESEIAGLRRELAEARGVIRDQAAAMAAMGRAGRGPVRPASGASCGNTQEARRAGA